MSRRMPLAAQNQADMRVPAAASGSQPRSGQFTRRPRRMVLLNLPLVWRLTIGFLFAALIAAAASGLSGLQRAQQLSRESSFYESLLRSNTALTTGNNFLQLMGTKLDETLVDASAPNPSRETLAGDQTALQGLATRYDAILTDFTHAQLLAAHPDEVAQLAEANHSSEAGQQRTLAASALRTWRVYRDAQTQVLQDVASGNLADATTLLRSQAQPTNADALSAMRALIQFDGRIATSVHDAAVVEQQYSFTISLIAGALAFLLIAAAGWLISNTIVWPLRLLRRVTQDVERGRMGARVAMVGRDEIASVAGSVNGMLDTIVGLLEVSQRQRDAMVSAAERLFTDVRVAGGGDLRVNAYVSGDPIGLLGNAFNFTIGRFRRFILRSQSTVDQLDVVAHQVHERAHAFVLAARTLPAPAAPAPASADSWSMPGLADSRAGGASDGSLTQQVLRARDLVRDLGREGGYQQAHTIYELAEQAYLAAGRLAQLISQSAQGTSPGVADERGTQAQLAELRGLSEVLSQLGFAAQAARQQTGTGFSDLEAALDQIGSLAVRQVSREAAPQWLGGAPNHPGTPPVDLARLSAAFANDVAALARQILNISVEMREGLTPFRLEAGSAGEMGQFGAPALPSQFGPGAQMGVLGQPGQPWPMGQSAPSWPGSQAGQMGQFGPLSGPRQPSMPDANPGRASRPRWDAPAPPSWG
jgi:methyl-accepting chemotaxis protein